MKDFDGLKCNTRSIEGHHEATQRWITNCIDVQIAPTSAGNRYSPITRVAKLLDHDACYDVTGSVTMNTAVTRPCLYRITPQITKAAVKSISLAVTQHQQGQCGHQRRSCWGRPLNEVRGARERGQESWRGTARQRQDSQPGFTVPAAATAVVT